MKRPIPLTPALLVATVNAFVGLGEDRGRRTGSPQGELVECFLREVRGRIRAEGGNGTNCANGATGSSDSTDLVPWDAAFVHHAGYWSHYHSDAARS